jgi:hypothetical protein
MKLPVWTLSFALLAVAGCKRANPKETQMSGEPSRPAVAQVAEPPIAAPGEKIAAPGEKIAAPGETLPSPAGTDPAPLAAAPAAKDTSYNLVLQVPAEAATGKVTVANVKVTPGKGYKVNEEYPTKLTLEATDGVTIAKPVMAKADAAAFDKHQLAFDVKLTPTRAGTFTVRGKLSFAVCTDATCDPKSDTVAISLNAK